jgi:phage protein U
MNLSLVMMALGTFRFGLSNGGYQEFSREAGYRWNKVDRLGRAPALQYAGEDVQTATLEGVIYPHFKGGLRQVELMRLQAGTGVPFMMVDGLGWVWKKWCITGVTERKKYLMRDGAPRRIDFSITLQSYGADSGGLSSFIGDLL